MRAGPAGAGRGVHGAEQRAHGGGAVLGAHVEVAETGDGRVGVAVGEQARVEGREDPDPRGRAALHRLAPGDDEQLRPRAPRRSRRHRADSGEATTIAPVRSAMTSAP